MTSLDDLLSGADLKDASVRLMLSDAMEEAGRLKEAKLLRDLEVPVSLDHDFNRILEPINPRVIVAPGYKLGRELAKQMNDSFWESFLNGP